MSIVRLFVLLGFALNIQTSFAGVNEDLEALKNVPRSYEDSGAICEEVARLDLKREYQAPQYEVIVGIAYADSQRTIGELDVVIFDKNINKVVKIAEVKCWKDMKAGLAKAKDQRARFIKTLNSGRQIFFKPNEGNGQFDRQHFEHNREFIAIGPRGSVDHGYDDELEHDLRTLHKMGSEMRRCQAFGSCAKP
ncbi:MAG: hypothetical protein ACLGGX_12715 [Bdellovibrionia bacterium]